MAMDELSRSNSPLPHESYITLLRACCKRKAALLHAKHILAHMVLHRVDMDAYMGHSMVKALATCGDVDLAYSVVTNSSFRDASAWTCVISAYTKKSDGFRALEAYRSMLRLGVEPAQYTFVCLFKACAAMGSLVEGKELHDHARRNGFCSDAYVGSSLMDMYSKCGDLVEAENVFCALPQRDVVTWNVMLFAQLRHNRAFKAMMLYRQMQEEGCGPNHLTFITLLQACDLLADERKHCTSHELAGKVLGLEIGKALHADAYKKPLCRSNPLLRNTLMAMYAKFGAIKASLQIFCVLRERVAASWNIMLSAHLRQGRAEECLQLYKQMLKDGVSADPLTLSIALQACGILIENDQSLVFRMVGSGIAEALHSDACFENYERDAFVGTALLSIYGKLGRMSETEYVFSELSSRDVVAWTAIISVFVEQEQGGKALQLYAQTESDGISPNHLTCIAGLQACSIFAAKQDASIVTKRSLKAISLDIGHSLHLDACLRGFTCDIRVMTAILCMYGECGSITESELVFNTEGIHGRDTVLWNAMLSIYVAEGKGERALALYVDMAKQNVIMDDVTLACMLQACGETGNIESCKKLHFVIISSCLEHLNCVGAALIHAYRSSGCMRDARECLDGIAYPDIVSWTSYVPSYPEQLDFEKSLKEIVSENHKLDDFILSLILACCDHGGLVEEGAKYFTLMNSKYGITRSLQHIGIIIDLFGRAGDFKRVHSILARMQNQVDMATCVNLLGACHIHNNVEMAKQVFSLVTSMHQRDSRVYVLMSNIYGSGQRE